MSRRGQELVYIGANIEYLTKPNRVEFLQILINSSMNTKYIKEKGAGTQFMTKHASDELVHVLYNFVRSQIKKMDDILQSKLSVE